MGLKIGKIPIFPPIIPSGSPPPHVPEKELSRVPNLRKLYNFKQKTTCWSLTYGWGGKLISRGTLKFGFTWIYPFSKLGSHICWHFLTIPGWACLPLGFPNRSWSTAGRRRRPCFWAKVVKAGFVHLKSWGIRGSSLMPFSHCRVIYV